MRLYTFVRLIHREGGERESQRERREGEESARASERASERAREVCACMYRHRHINIEISYRLSLSGSCNCRAVGNSGLVSTELCRDDSINAQCMCDGNNMF